MSRITRHRQTFLSGATLKRSRIDATGVKVAIGNDDFGSYLPAVSSDNPFSIAKIVQGSNGTKSFTYTVSNDCQLAIFMYGPDSDIGSGTGGGESTFCVRVFVGDDEFVSAFLLDNNVGNNNDYAYLALNVKAGTVVQIKGGDSSGNVAALFSAFSSSARLIFAEKALC